MTTVVRLRDFLWEKGVAYEIVSHPLRYTALETAEAEHIPGHMVAKVVMAKVKGQDTMFVIPADTQLDFFKVEREFGTSDITIAEESDFDRIFPDCERGAMPPFGLLYGIPCYVDAEFVGNSRIVFNAGNHEESVRMAMSDYLKLAEAVIGDFSVPRVLHR